jgi:hypothetical protein
MANRIVISYRRDDASGQAGRLYDHLVERFGENSVFMDIDTIPPGEQFDSYIDDVLCDCYMCIVVIGQRWSIERLHADGDFVRREIAAAFAHGVRVIPALFDGAKLPDVKKLPPEIAELVHCEAYDFGTGRSFRRQVTEFLAQVDRAVKEAKQRQRERDREALRGVALRRHQYPIWVLFVCALIALAVFTSLTWGPIQLRALASVWKAEAAQSNGDNLAAISQFRSALRLVPTSHRAKVGLATALFSTHSQEAAQEAMTLLQGVTLDKYDWDELVKVMPAEYQALFEVKKR